ncbi:DUF89 family protein [Thermosipho ferrireducens]|uniref:DUF89 family protein n=1 Tax=Thermosipho ferrireducens TaxID=2571116 RepID=A0ABX7S7M9_9BACT|nr:ARMT1-like domain-containing protein [Thermosipho ferrireducens]QTA37810.1 DUF89 family protein [Thermosipho ferrireducens]
MLSKARCLLCHVEQAQRVLDKFIHSEEEKWVLMQRILQDLSNTKYGLKPIEIAEILYTKLEEYIGINDIYKKEKELSNKIASRAVEILEDEILDSADPLYEAAKLAVTGNLIDFGTFKENHEKLITRVLELWNEPFGMEDIEEFKERLLDSSTLLYVADNAGEIVFDKFFIEIMKQTNPELYIAVAVKGAPIINDATVDDAIYSGINSVAEIINTELKTAGTTVEKASDSFRRAFFDYDIVIAKGQGNFEGLSDEKRENLYFALVAKCEVVANYIGVPKGTKLFINSRRIPQA